MGTVLGGLLLPKFDTFDYGRSVNQGILGASQQVQGQTALLALQEEKQKQQSMQMVYEAIKDDPALAQQLLGGSTIAGLPTTGGPSGGMPGAAPPPGPITQSPLGGGPAQQIPAYPDASRYAQVSPGGGGPMPPDVMAQGMPTVTPPGGAPGPVLASLGSGQGPPQAQQNPLIEMARRDPRAAMMLQQQIQGQQEQQWKMQEQRLKMGSTMMGSLGQMAQGVTDQAGWDQLRQDAAQIDPQLAARLPQVYSKEVRDRVVAQATGVKDTLTLQINEMKARADQVRAGLAGRTDAVNTELEIMGLAPATVSSLAQQGDPQAKAQLAEATNNAEQRQIRISALQGTGQIVKGPTGEYIRVKPGTNEVEVIKTPGGEPLREKPSETEQKGATLANSVAAANRLATELEDKGYKPKVWEKGIDKLPLGLGNYVTSNDYQKYRQTVREFASAWLYGVSGAQITDPEWENANQTFFPQPGEDKGAVELKRQRRAALVEQLRQQSQATGRTGTQPQPSSQAPAASSGKPVSQMSAEETRAEIAAIKARGGR